MDGKTIIFLPGFMCDERLFKPQITALRAKGMKCSLADLTQGISVRRIASQILLDAPPYFALVGLSMGGIIAQAIVKDAPLRVTHLALLNTTPHADMQAETRKEHLRRVGQGALEVILTDELKPKYLSPANRQSSIRPLIKEMGLRLGPEVFARQTVALMTRSSYYSNLRKIDCPTLLLTGSDDTICPPSLHEDMGQHIRGSTLTILKNCGHLSSLEKPNAVTEALTKLLSIDALKSQKRVRCGQTIKF